MNDQRKKGFGLEALQGLLSLLVLWYAMFGDPSRLPSDKWIGTAPGGFFASPGCFQACVLLLFALEGVRAACRRGEAESAPLRATLRVYGDYWRVAVPLTAVGFAFFNVKQSGALYCPVFAEPTALNIAGALAAVTNDLHEGAWLVFCLVVCALFTALYDLLRRRSRWAAALMPALGIGTAALLYCVIVPFPYNETTYPLAAVLGTAGYFAAFLISSRLAAKGAFPGERSRRLADSRAARIVAAPLRWLGRHWAQLWIVQFFVCFYYYSVAVSVYSAAGSAWLSYLLFLALGALIIFTVEHFSDDLLRAWRGTKWSALSVPAMLGLPFLLHFALEASSDYGLYNKLAPGQWPFYTLASVAGIFCVLLVLRALTGRWFAAGVVATVLLTLLAVVNHFTIIYHGTLLTPEDAANIRTAANVAGSYDFSIDEVTRSVLFYGLGGLGLCVVAWLTGRKAHAAFERSRRWAIRALSLLTAVVTFFFLYLSDLPVVSNEEKLNWDRLYARLGYFNGTVEYFHLTSGGAVRKPAEYSEERVAELAAEAEAGAVVTEAEEQLPDIILILNETWYDLDDYMDTNADVDYMHYFNSMKNAVKGRVIVPIVGGGTNASEYESLTGCSSSLINAYSPYNRMEMDDQITLPSYLKQFGYSAFGAHPVTGTNYNRVRRWAQMGLDPTYFIEDFTKLKYYGKRKGRHIRCTDISAFKNMVRFYKAQPEDSPRFGFFITIQNHGGWHSNPKKLALVHADLPDVKNKDLKHEINEYLSCMKLTDDSINYLQEYYTKLYETTGRRAVICMYGDHCTSMLRTMNSLSRYDDPETRERVKKSTPYFIWANYPLDLDAMDLEGTDVMDLSCLMPTLLDVAGVPLSYFYRHIVDMRSDVMLFTNVSSDYTSISNDTLFCDRDGVIHSIEEGGAAAQQVIDYYCMEYNLSANPKERETALFVPRAPAK